MQEEAMSSEIHLCKEAAEHRTCPKIVGGDFELGNIILGEDPSRDTTYRASAAILRQIDGFPKNTRYVFPTSSHYDDQTPNQWNEPTSWEDDSWNHGYNWHDSAYGGVRQRGARGQAINPQDYARRWLPNGGCIYGDLGHTEVAIPEVRSAYEAVRYFHGMLLIVREALRRANRELPRRALRIVVTVNNSDGHGHSWGGHTNFAITTECYRNIFERKLHYALFLASHLTSSIVYTGAGKVGSETEFVPAAPFEITQRGDFYETITGIQTTYNRPLINSRNEPLTGADTGIARLHCIFFDSTLSQGSAILKWGTTQLVLAMMEQGIVPSDLILEDPLESLTVWNQDPDLRAKAKVISGAYYTAVEMQLAIFAKVRSFVESGRADYVVPRAGELLQLWGETLNKLKEGDLEALIPRVEWILKRHVLERAMSRRGLDWSSPEIKHLDHTFSSIDPDEGLFWHCQRAGLLEQFASESEIERAVILPPEDTRAWLRGNILKHAEAEAIEAIDWDRIMYKQRKKSWGGWSSASYYTLKTDNPLHFTRQDCEHLFTRSSSIGQIFGSLGAEETDSFGYPLPGARKEAMPLPIAPPSRQIPGRNPAESKKLAASSTWVRRESGGSDNNQQQKEHKP